MNDVPRTSTYLIILSVITCLTLIATPSSADVEATKQRFESCVATEIESERAKPNPSASKVLGACEAEFQTLLQSVPPGVAGELRHKARHYVEQQLKR